jgi:hypothetical protein
VFVVERARVRAWCSLRVFDFFVKVGGGEVMCGLLAELGKDSSSRGQLNSTQELFVITGTNTNKHTNAKIKGCTADPTGAGSPRFAIRFMIHPKGSSSSNRLHTSSNCGTDVIASRSVTKNISTSDFTTTSHHGEHQAGTTSEFGG